MQPRKLRLQKNEDIYRSILDVYPSEGLSVTHCQKKLVFYVLGWLKNKLEGEKTGCSNDEFLAQITDVPVIKKSNKILAPEVYDSYDLTKTNGIGADNVMHPHLAYYEKESKWAMELSEIAISEGRDSTFRTAIAVYPEDDHVVMAIKCTAGYDTGNDMYIPGYRPQFVRDAIWDDELAVTEHGIDKAYAFGRYAIEVNGKSDMACEEFRKGLLFNENRKLPVLLISEDEAAELIATTERDDIIDRIAYSSVGFCHVIQVQKSVRKLLAEHGKEYMDHILQGEVAFLGQTPMYFTREEYAEKFAFDSERNYFCGTFSEDRDLELRRCDIRYDSDIFFRDVFFQEKINRLTGDAATIEDLRSALAQCREELEETKRDLKFCEILRDEDWHECQLDIEDLNEKIKKLEDENGKLSRRIESLENSQNDKSSDVFQKRCDELEKENAELKKRSGGSTFKQFYDRHEALFDMPITNSADDILSWIEEYYSDCLIVHEKAKRSLSDCTWRVDSDSYHNLYYMIHYLAGYTRYVNSEEIDQKDWEKLQEEYRTILSGVEMAPVGDATSKYKDQYTINISSYYNDAIAKGIVDEKKRKDAVILDKHLKRGVGARDEEGLIRIYYYYDRDLKKTFIGYMPGHLSTITGGR